MSGKKDRLEQAAEECQRLNPRSAAQAAKLLRRRVLADRELRRSLADRFMDNNIATLIAQVREGTGAASPTLANHLAAKGQSLGTGTGHRSADAQGSAASEGSEKEGRANPGMSPILGELAPPPSKPVTPPAKPPRSVGPSAFVQQSVARGMLDSYAVNGVAIGDLTGREVREAARSQHTKAAFLIRVANGVPDTMLVRKAWTDTDLTRFYSEAIQDADRGVPLTKPVIEATKPAGYSEVPHA